MLLTLPPRNTPTSESPGTIAGDRPNEVARVCDAPPYEFTASIWPEPKIFSYIRKVDPSGSLSTIAGNGQWGYSGNSISQTISPFVDGNGNIYFADIANNCVRELIAQ